MVVGLFIFFFFSLKGSREMDTVITIGSEDKKGFSNRER